MFNSVNIIVFYHHFFWIINQSEQVYVTAAASGTEYSGKVTASSLLVTCYSLVIWNTYVAHDY